MVLKTLVLAGCLVATTTARAQPDYPLAHWVPPACVKWYTSGNPRQFCVIHDMEGYYQSSVSYLNRCDKDANGNYNVSASVHYLVNGLQNGSDSSGHRENNPGDAAAGDITQSVRESNYAWHARCWNTWMFGTEHEGFVNNPAWYTEAMYQASARLQRHLCDVYGIPIDRNHIIGHDEKKNASWVSWMAANFPSIDATCNTHTDPGIYWDWSHFITLINSFSSAPTILTPPQGLALDPGSTATFDVTAAGATPLYYQWRFNGTNLAGATATNYTRANVQAADAGNYSVVISNSVGAVTSAVAALTVNSAPSITAQPQDQIVPLGQNPTFDISAVGTSPLRFQWRFNGSNIPGATASTYTVADAHGTNGGAYSVIVTNALGTAVSSNALLAVVPVAAWGDNGLHQISVLPDSTNVIAVAGGDWHSVSLRANGTVLAWGNNYSGQCDAPTNLTDAVAIAAGGYHNLAIRSDCTVVAWGANYYGQVTTPSGLANVIAIAAGTWHSLALRANGTVVAWGDNSLGQANVPAGLANVVAIAAGGNHSLALKGDGTVVAWGENMGSEGYFAGQSSVPWGLTNVAAIAAGEFHSLALKRDGTVVAWGDNSRSQSNVPGGLAGVVAVAGGGAHSVALRSDGTTVAWGDNLNGQCNIPASWSNALAAAAGGYHTLVLLEETKLSPRLFRLRRNGSEFSALLQTFSRSHYALEFKNSIAATNWTALPTVTGNGALRLLTDPAATTTQRFYRIRQW